MILKKLPSLAFFSYVNNVVLWGNKQNVNAMTSSNLHHQITMDTEMCCPTQIIYHISFVILETENSMVVFGICI